MGSTVSVIDCGIIGVSLVIINRCCGLKSCVSVVCQELLVDGKRKNNLNRDECLLTERDE